MHLLCFKLLAGNEDYKCTPGDVDAQCLGWQRPCYLLGEGYAETFKELIEDTEWKNMHG